MAEKQVVAFGPFKDFIADGVRVGDTIHLSGAVSVDEQGQTVHAGDIVHETLFVTDMGAIMGGEDKMGAFLRDARGSVWREPAGQPEPHRRQGAGDAGAPHRDQSRRTSLSARVSLADE